METQTTPDVFCLLVKWDEMGEVAEGLAKCQSIGKRRW